MTVLPLMPAVARTPEQRDARAQALRRILGPVSGWSEVERERFEERVAIVGVEGGLPRDEAERVAIEGVRAGLLRAVP